MTVGVSHVLMYLLTYHFLDVTVGVSHVLSDRHGNSFELSLLYIDSISNIVPCKLDNNCAGRIVFAMLTYSIASVDVVFMNS